MTRYVGFEILSEVGVMITASWNMTPYNLVEVY
jgi:phosphomannomutase